MKSRLIKSIADSLESWQHLPPSIAANQSQFAFAQELSATGQAIELGLLDEEGNTTKRTRQLINQYHESDST